MEAGGWGPNMRAGGRITQIPVQETISEWFESKHVFK